MTGGRVADGREGGGDPPALVSRYRVAAMDCSAEEQLVRMALGDVPGVGRIDVDLDAREIRVAHATDRAVLDDALASLDLGASHLDDATVDEASTGTGATGATDDERSALRLALVINAAFFVGEVGFGLLSRSMGVVADGLDMGADAAVYALSLAAVGMAAARKKRLARASGIAQFVLACLGLIEVLRRTVAAGEVPDAGTMVVVSLLALVGNAVVLVALRRVRTGEAHIEASWIFTANDVKVNLLVIVAAALTPVTDSAVPDLVAGAIIFGVVANGARRILAISR